MAIENLTDCPGFEGCTAPICPLDKSFTKAAWYVDEPICMARAFRKDHWRIIQRKIVKKNLTRPVEGFFDVDLLNKIHRVAGGIKGFTERQGVINPLERGMIIANACGSDNPAENENDVDDDKDE